MLRKLPPGENGMEDTVGLDHPLSGKGQSVSISMAALLGAVLHKIKTFSNNIK